MAGRNETPTGARTGEPTVADERLHRRGRRRGVRGFRIEGLPVARQLERHSGEGFDGDERRFRDTRRWLQTRFEPVAKGLSVGIDRHGAPWHTSAFHTVIRNMKIIQALVILILMAAQSPSLRAQGDTARLAEFKAEMEAV